MTVHHFRDVRQATPSEIIDDIARRYGISREAAGNLPAATLRRIRADGKEIIDAEFEVLTG